MSYSHMGKPHTTISAIIVSLLDSAWNQVGPQCYGRQANFKIPTTQSKSVSNSSAFDHFIESTKPLGVVWLASRAIGTGWLDASLLLLPACYSSG